MSLVLVKGEKVDLTKSAPGLKKVAFAAGWDINQAAGGASYDLDIFAVALGADGKPLSGPQVTFFGNKTGIPGVELDGDNLTGEGDGDDETITVTLASVPSDVQSLLLAVNIYQAVERGQRFGMVQNSYIRAYDADTNTEAIRYDLNEDFGSNTGVILGKAYRHNSEWKFEAIGTGVNGDINQIISGL